MPRTDLALEATELWRQRAGDPGELPGVVTRQRDSFGFPLDEVRVTTEEGARAVGKPVGTYLTLTMEALLSRRAGNFESAVQAVAQSVRALLPKALPGCVLLVGLGNRAVTPDAIGPRAVDCALVTRHIIARSPDQFSDLRPVAALSPGVLSSTGVESAELIRAVAGPLSPGLVVAVDALAARSVHRLGTTVQIADTGITPGSGVGNTRAALDRETLGVPVLAVGVPTVVDGDTLAADLAPDAAPQQEACKGLLVTPKDIDSILSDLAKILGYGISLALQDALTVEDLETLLS